MSDLEVEEIDQPGDDEVTSLEEAGAVDQVAWSLHDSQGNKLTTGSFKPSALGGFDLSITLPKTPNLGDAYLNFEVQAGRMKAASFAHSLQIQEFRRPEYEVKAGADAGPHLVGGHADLEVSAQYFAGGPLANAEVHWAVTASPGTYAPPGHDGYTFGRWRPWWDFMLARPRYARRLSPAEDARGPHRRRR